MATKNDRIQRATANPIAAKLIGKMKQALNGKIVNLKDFAAGLCPRSWGKVWYAWQSVAADSVDANSRMDWRPHFELESTAHPLSRENLTE